LSADRWGGDGVEIMSSPLALLLLSSATNHQHLGNSESLATQPRKHPLLCLVHVSLSPHPLSLLPHPLHPSPPSNVVQTPLLLPSFPPVPSTTRLDSESGQETGRIKKRPDSLEWISKLPKPLGRALELWISSFPSLVAWRRREGGDLPQAPDPGPGVTARRWLRDLQDPKTVRTEKEELC